MGMSEQELIEFKKALETVKEYEKKLDIKLLNKRQTMKIMKKIEESIIERNKLSIEERLDKLEQRLSQLINREIDEKKHK